MNQLLVEADLRQAEWIVTGFVAQEPRMMEVFYNRRDPHLTTGIEISNAPEEFIKEEEKLVGHSNDPDEIRDLRMPLLQKWASQLDQSTLFLPRSVSIRQAGKKANHGLNYRLEYKNFALYNEMEEGEAKKIVDKYRNKAYRRLPIWYQEIENQLRKDRTLTTCFGDKRRFLGELTHELFMAATAQIPQSTIARVTKYGMNRVYYDNWKWMRKCVDIRAQVHDSIVLHVTFDNSAHLADILRRVRMHMSEECIYHHREFTVPVDFKIGRRWGSSAMIEVKESQGLEIGLAEAWDKALAA